jgi:hypothetical protein
MYHAYTASSPKAERTGAISLMSLAKQDVCIIQEFNYHISQQ